jgi:hypothetical protein
LAVLSVLSFLGCPYLDAISRQSFFSSPELAVLSWRSFSGFLSLLSCPVWQANLNLPSLLIFVLMVDAYQFQLLVEKSFVLKAFN